MRTGYTSDTFSESNIALFVQIEEELYEGDHSTAGSILASMDIDEENPVEVNYQNYYQLHISYLSGLASEEAFSTTDSTLLVELTGLCPGLDGACIYQARALYNTIYKQSTVFPECGEDPEAKKADTDNKDDFFAASKTEMDLLKIYPNPAGDHLIIEGSEVNRALHIRIKDLTGRIVLERDMKILNKAGVINLSLINGMYLMTISNENDEKVIKKLLISN